MVPYLNCQHFLHHIVCCRLSLSPTYGVSEQSERFSLFPFGLEQTGRLSRRLPVAAGLQDPSLRDRPPAGAARLAVPDDGCGALRPGIDQARGGGADVPGHERADEPRSPGLSDAVRRVSETLENAATLDEYAAV